MHLSSTVAGWIDVGAAAVAVVALLLLLANWLTLRRIRGAQQTLLAGGSEDLVDVKVKVEDPLSAHFDLLGKYTDAEMHNVYAYLESMK